MRKIYLFTAAAAALALFAGCAGIQTTPAKDLSGEKLSVSGKPVAHLNADNWGLYLFMIPLITGSTDEPGSTVFLQDTVNTQKVLNMMTKKSKALGADATYNITSRHNANGWMFYFRDVQVTGNAVSTK